MFVCMINYIPLVDKNYLFYLNHMVATQVFLIADLHQFDW